MNNAPFFSILIPSYNRPEYIISCLESILRNNYQDYEIIISDDHSPRSDEIEQKIDPYLKQHHNIQYYRQPINLKEPGNKNFLIGKARGKYNIILGDDDQLYPDSLKIIKKYIDQNPNYELYCFGYTIVDENNIYYYSRSAPEKLEISFDSIKLAMQLFVFDMFPFWLFHPAVFCCKSGVEKNIKYSLEAGIGEDLLFLIDFINYEKNMFIIPEVLFKWRKIQNDENVEQKNQSLGDLSNILARKEILYHLLDRTDLKPILAELFSSFEYRKYFLYNSIIIDKDIKNNSILDLKLDKIHLNEYNIYSNKSNYYNINFQPYIKRSFDFIKLFGIKGFYQLVKISFERIYYKLKIII